MERARRIAWTGLGSLVLIALLPVDARGQGPPDGQLTTAFDASIATSFLDPAETAGLGTPFVFLYALHDALTKPLPRNDMAPCSAEPWRESPYGLAYEFAASRLRMAARYWHATLSLESPSRALRVEITDGRIASCRESDSGQPATITVVASDDGWAQFLAPVPRPFYQDLLEKPARFRENILPVLDEIRARPAA